LEEVFSRNRFPTIKDSPYVFTLGFHDYYWFLIRKKEEIVIAEKRQIIPELEVSGSWEAVFKGKTKEKLEGEILPLYIEDCRWFGGKTRNIQQIEVIENITVGEDHSVTQLLFLEVRYTEGLPDVYLLPLSFSSGNEAEKISKENPQAVVTLIKNQGIIYDGVYNEEFQKNLFQMISGRHTVKGLEGQLTAYHGELFKNFKGKELTLEKSQVLKAEQSNTSILYGKELFFKLYRRLDEGINPDLEITRFLTEETSFPNIPPFVGAIEYRRNGILSASEGSGSQPIIIGILQRFTPNQGDAWTYTLDSVRGYFERVLSRRKEIGEVPKTPSSLLEIAYEEIPPLFRELIGGIYIEMANLLGKRTAELHLALSSSTEDPNFAPEPFSVLYQRSVYQSMESLTKRVFELLGINLKNLKDTQKQAATEILGFQKEIMEQFKALFKKKISAMKIRIHGDYHLGQVLYTGNDFVIIDFEGEPARAVSERRLKRSPIRDVAGMIRSFHYSVYNSLFKHVPLTPEELLKLEPWTDLWYKYVAGLFLRSYLDTAKDAPFIPRNREELNIMLRAHLLEKAIYELGYELNYRPDWVIIPIKGIKDLLKA
ncbi:MAG: putative maltokinase, partial [Thermodesulfobacteriota bacterium]